MGKPSMCNDILPSGEYIACWGQRGEVNHLSNHRKRKQCDSVSSGERTWKSLKRKCAKVQAVALSWLWGDSGVT